MVQGLWFCGESDSLFLGGTMSRNFVAGFGGLIVGAGVDWSFGYSSRTPRARFGLTVRVSGGSITLISKSSWSCDSGTSSSCTKLSTLLRVKSDTPVQASHVQQQAGQEQGNPIDVTYPPSILGSWVVTVATKNSEWQPTWSDDIKRRLNCHCGTAERQRPFRAKRSALEVQERGSRVRKL